MDSIKISQEWFDIAEMDIASAKYLQNMHPIPIEIICYHCQQSAEKFLKGFLALNEHENVKTHDLLALTNLCIEYEKEFEAVLEECLRLTDYGVNVRYPYPIDLNKSDMRIAIKDTEIIKDFVLRKVDAIKTINNSENLKDN